MKNAGAVAVLLLAFIAFSTAQTQTTKMLELTPEQVQRVEILYFPEKVLVRAALTPERLEQLYDYKVEIRDVHRSAEWQQLVPLLGQTSLKADGRSYDHRTAVLLFNNKDKRIASLYFDQFGVAGTINGESGKITGGVYRWAKSLLKGVTR